MRCGAKTKYLLWCFFGLYLVLPSYFALELSESLPLLTASRAILLLMAAACVMRNHIIVKIDRALVTYGIILMVVCLYHILTNENGSIRVEAVKVLFSVVVEQLLLFVILRNLIPDRAALISGLELMVKACGLISVLAIAETLSGVNVFYFLTTTQREMLQASYERLNFLRAEGPFGHPVYLSVYLVCMLPLILYFYERTGKRMYAGIAAVDIIAIFCTGSRGGLLVVLLLMAAMLVMKKRNEKIKLIKLLALLLVLVVMAVVFVPAMLEYGQGIFLSLMSSLGISTYESADFGENASGVASRFVQLSGLAWVAENDALVMGLGADAHMYGLVSFFDSSADAWIATDTLDIGYIAYVILYGIVGTAGFAVLFGSAAYKAWRKAKQKEPSGIYNAFVYLYLAFFLCLLYTAGIEKIILVPTILMLVYEQLPESGKQESCSALGTSSLRNIAADG